MKREGEGEKKSTPPHYEHKCAWGREGEREDERRGGGGVERERD